MAEKKPKFYVVWKGHNPGIYTTWEECKAQTSGFSEARYRAYPNIEEAEVAFAADFVPMTKRDTDTVKVPKRKGDYIRQSIAVDAACSGNPGLMEYRGVDVQTGRELFRVGPYPQGTNNIGEFLALVHGLALLKLHNSPLPLYSDSVNAIAWVRKKQCRTKLERSPINAPIFDLIERAEKWLQENSFTTQILKWDTPIWGEIPADFGRK